MHEEIMTASCVHLFVFLRSEERDGYSKKVDVFYCQKCCEYKEVVVWEGRRF